MNEDLKEVLREYIDDGGDQGVADRANAELDALTEHVRVLEGQLKTAQRTALYFWKLPYGVRTSKVMQRVIDKYNTELSGDAYVDVAAALVR